MSLSQELETALKYYKLEIPSHIKDNLSKELRDYQEQAIKHFYLQRQEPKTNHLMFHMATGSGKTLVMAGLILDCYQRGYRDFVFFVHRTTIIEKTKANFADPASSKYLFKDQILINSQNIQINVIENFSESREDCINIHFTTIQTLYSLFKNERENALSLEDLKERKIVFLADEAHHLNADTKKSKQEQEEKEGWEAMIQKAYESHSENLLLEFTATIPTNQAVKEKYIDKIVFEYDLAHFCKEGYSKRIFVMKYQSEELQDRFLGAILLSLFRQLLAYQNGITLKPAILFKSESVLASKNNQEKFLEFLQNLNAKRIEEFYQGAYSKEGDFFQKSGAFFKKYFQEGVLEKLASALKHNFKKEYHLNANDDKDVEKNQILLNSLEDKDNEIRVIFAVEKLNEGWDVLNLFDIVRLGSGSGKTTTSEVQLIGRGARYFPFQSKQMDFAPSHKRKFDLDLENDLSLLERLSYHTRNEVDFINKLNQNLRDQGILLDESQKRLELVPSPRAKKIMQSHQIYYAKNKRIRKGDLGLFAIPKEEIEEKIRYLEIPLFSKQIKEQEEKFEALQEEQNLQRNEKIKDKIQTKYFLKAMNILGMSFQSLKKNFDFKSKNELIESYLGEIEVRFQKDQIFDPQNKLKIAIYILENFQTQREKIKQEFEVTEFEAHRLDMQRRVIFCKNDRAEEANYEWLYYNEFSLDSKLEKEFLKFIEASQDKINAMFSEWFVIRNDGFDEFKIFDNRKDSDTYGFGFEPDFIFFGKRKGEKSEILSIECFMEVKGESLVLIEAWKERFLETLKQKSFQTLNSHYFRLDSLPFFRETTNNRKFFDAFELFLNDK